MKYVQSNTVSRKGISFPFIQFCLPLQYVCLNNLIVTDCLEEMPAGNKIP
jgi:hypothetical protein